MESEEQHNWAVRCLPYWYVTFYLSWKYADIDKHVIWYDEYYKDQVKGLRQIFDFTGISRLGSVTDEALDMASQVHDPGLSRFQFGRPGRGREVFTPQQIADVEDQLLIWPEREELIQNLIWRGYD